MAYGPSQKRKLSDKGVQEVNLIPIMNLFIVVIPMLMTIMVSAHLAMTEIALPSASGGGGEAEEEQMEELPKEITLGLYKDRFEILVEGEAEIREIPIQEDGSYDFVNLDKQLAALKGEHENQNTVEILPTGDVLFDVLLRSIDICKSNDFPNIKYLTTQKKLLRAKR
jgi:biopolymer transport protein ExbD